MCAFPLPLAHLIRNIVRWRCYPKKIPPNVFLRTSQTRPNRVVHTHPAQITVRLLVLLALPSSPDSNVEIRFPEALRATTFFLTYYVIVDIFRFLFTLIIV